MRWFLYTPFLILSLHPEDKVDLLSQIHFLFNSFLMGHHNIQKVNLCFILLHDATSSRSLLLSLLEAENF